ncbi:MAG: methyltransferase domain-containing protein [Desulfosudaceae bacterium]
MIRSRNEDGYYKRIGYGRWCSYFSQMEYISECRPDSVLELGVGDGIMSSILRKMGYEVFTCDLSSEVEADVTADITNLPFRDNSFDVVAAFQVLEHLPYERFVPCLRGLGRISRKYVLISLPQIRKYIDFQLHLPWMKKNGYLGWFRDIPRIPAYREPAGHQHYWEIGVKSYPLKRIVADMRRAGFTISVNRTLPENNYHRFFVLASPGD